MGMSRTIYLGVFIQCKKSTLVDEHTEIVCPNDHKVGVGRRFCPECGSKTISKKVTEIGFMRLSDMVYNNFLSEDYEEVMMSWSGMKEADEVLVSNGGKRFGFFLEEYDPNIDLSEIDMIGSIAEFKEEYKDFIAATEPYYEEYNIIYGVTSWYW